MSPDSDLEHAEVQLELELGHRARPKPKADPTTGYTHEWEVFIRGLDNCKIEKFVEKVIFKLHGSFKPPIRVLKEPPYEIRESGYAGFDLPVEIHFRNKEEPRKISYTYDLFLNTQEAVYNLRREKLTFQNPSPEFMKKLLKAGGKLKSNKKIDLPDRPSSSASKQIRKQTISSPRTPSSQGPNSPADVKPNITKSCEIVKVPQHRLPGKDIQRSFSPSVPQPSSSATPPPKPPLIKDAKPVKIKKETDSAFTDLFGPPIQARPSPEPLSIKIKVEKKEKTDDKSTIFAKKAETEQKQDKISSDNKSIVNRKNSKAGLDISSPLPSLSRSRNDIPSPKQSTDRVKDCVKDSSSKKTTVSSKKKKKKRSRSPSASSSHSDSDSDKSEKSQSERKSFNKKQSNSVSDYSRKDDYKKIRSSEKNESSDAFKKIKKEKSPTDEAPSSSKNASSHKVKEEKERKKKNFTSSSTTIVVSNNNNTGTTTLEIKSVKKEKSWDSESKKEKSRNEKVKSNNHPSTTDASSQLSSDDHESGHCSSLGTPDSQTNGRVKDRHLSSPSRVDSKSKKSKKKKRRHSHSADEQSCNDSDEEDPSHKTKSRNNRSLPSGPTASKKTHVQQLLLLRETIDKLTDSNLLQEIVDMIGDNDSDCLVITDKTVDFDLLSLSENSISKIKEILREVLRN